MGTDVKRLPPPTASERKQAQASAAAIRAAIADPATAGEPVVAHVNYGGLRGAWVTIWPNLPGLLSERRGRLHYSHALLPGWTYTVREMRTEMLEDLERLAETGERPTVATSAPAA